VTYEDLDIDRIIRDDINRCLWAAFDRYLFEEFRKSLHCESGGVLLDSGVVLAANLSESAD
jgi:hypothetical protein